MALKVYNHGYVSGYGQFDCVDADMAVLKGGEVLTLAYVTARQFAGTDLDALDVEDGYVSDSKHTRPALTKTLSSGNRPLWLCDDGQIGYGSMFGTVVGGTAGSVVSGGAFLGPASMIGSGKVTAWQGPGLFGVTLDAVDKTATTGLVQTNTTLSGGAALYATVNGILTPNVSLAFESVVVGRFIEFQTNGSKVTTPSNLVSGFASPSAPTGLPGSAGSGFDHALISFDPEL